MLSHFYLSIYNSSIETFNIFAMSMGIAACGGSGDKKDDNTITVWCWDKTFNIFAME